ncbi:hypothetical protein BWQ96_00374 [Gracilariopsis chorda]|uniref:Uncharacterized protein n=1 Tax=Gracilariopsis chorda TaxID=448386 RepID=A0A2V3J6G4_9FLOR|nr:hypothetical protein BWQ96_00374 [Gracilariopsis chorda]|eukprot:PXF49722.1 hypothetical protein BWQ96_00374 [Gracilariopsis chorda]
MSDEHYLPWTLPITPISIAFSRCIAQASMLMINDHLCTPKTLLHSILRQSSSRPRESLRTDDLSYALKLFPELSTPSEEKKNRMLVIRAINLLIKAVIEASSPSRATWKPKAEELKHSNLILEPVTPATELYSATSSLSPSDSYSFVKTQEQKNDENEIHCAAHAWLKFLKHAEFHSHLKGIPSKLISGLDLQIDEHVL